MRRRFFAPVLLVLLMASAIGLQALRERGGELPVGPDSLLYVRSSATLQRLALSYDSIVADVYWIRAIQVYGNTRLGRTADRSYDLLYPLLELATTLDPYFDVAYQFGALFLAEKQPGAEHHPDGGERGKKGSVGDARVQDRQMPEGEVSREEQTGEQHREKRRGIRPRVGGLGGFQPRPQPERGQGERHPPKGAGERPDLGEPHEDRRDPHCRCPADQGQKREKRRVGRAGRKPGSGSDHARFREDWQAGVAAPIMAPRLLSSRSLFQVFGC